MRVYRSVAPLIIAAFLTAGLVACSTAEADAPAATATPETAPESEQDAAADEEAAAEPKGDVQNADWAKPVTIPGELLATASGSNFRVDVYQVGTAAATKTGNFVNPETNLPIISVGDEVVYVNWVVTNTSTETIPLSFNLVDVSPRYADWPYMQGMDSIVDFDLNDQMQINTTAITPGLEAPFQFEPGDSYSQGTNFRYQAGSPIVFSLTLTPADAEGDLVHDDKQTLVAETTIK